ncbi:MAG: peptidase M14, partial [Psychroflexus halocasei]
MEEDLNLYQELYKDYSDIKSPIGAVRYLSEPLINKLNYQISHQHQIVNEGNSVLDRVISSFEFGYGSFKILIWSQMHGNESTTTKAVYDL